MGERGEGILGDHLVLRGNGGGSVVANKHEGRGGGTLENGLAMIEDHRKITKP